MKILAILLAAVAVAGAINPAAIYRSRCSEGTSYWCLSVAQADECGAVEYCIQNVWRGQSVQESPACSDCDTFVNGVRNVLEQTSVQDEILQGAKMACTVMGSLASTCENAVDTLGPEVLKTLVTELTADKVCALLKFCPGSSLQSPNDDEICTLCKDFMSAANALVSNATLQQEVEDTILALCPLLETFIPNCAETVKTDFPIIVQLLLTYLKPSTCVDLGVCTSNSPARQFVQKVMKIKSLRNEDESQLCSDCMTYVSALDTFLSNPAIQEAVILELDQLCYTLGVPLTTLCKYAVNTYTKPVFAELVTVLNPQTFCPRIGFCPSLSLPKVSKMRSAPGDDCADCEALIKDIDGMLMNQTVQNMIIQDLDDLCAQLGSFSSQCQSYVDQYAELVFDTIASFLDPDQVCQTIGFCQSKIWNKLSQKLHSKAPGDTCADCEAFIKDIDGLLSNTTVQHMIIEELDAFCTQLGSFAAQCKSYVDDFAPLVFSELATLLDPQTVCQGIGFCSSTTSVPRMPFKVFKADPALCSDCKTLITDVDGMLSNQTVQQMILTELQTLCQYAGTYQLECKLLIQTYGPTVFQYLETALNPDTVCTEIGFCTSDAAPAQLSVPAASIQSAVSLLAAQPVQPVKANRPKPPVTRVSDEDCDLCKVVMHLFAEVFSDNKTEEEILNDFEVVCNILPEAERQECRNYISTYGYLIIELLSQSLSPDNICRELGFCSSSQSLREPMKALKAVLSRLPTADTPFCSICQLFVQELDVILSSNKSKTEIVQEVEKLICDNLPSPLNTQCVSFMEIYGDVLVQLLLEQFNPQTFCAEVGLCDSSAAVATASVDKAVSADASTECVICEFVMTELDELLSENATKEEIIAALDKVCSVLPDTLRDECVTFVNTYGQDIIAALEKELDPSKVCTTLGLCTSAVAEAVSVECVTCEYVMSALDRLLDENSTKEEIIAAVDKVCAILPATVRDECVTLVNTYGPAIIAALEEKLDPKTICTTLGLCDSTKLAAPSSSPQCSICELVVASMDTIIGQNKTQERIKAALEKTCNVLPSVVQPVCRQFVNKFQTALISAFLNMEPEQICSYLSLCDFQLKLKLSLGSIECDVCQDAVREFMNEIQEPSVTKEIVSIISDTCGILPDDLKTECFTYVDQYGSLVTQFIAQFFDPITTCTLIGACPTPANEPRKQLLGQHECSRGPGFWCASRENAMRCNMVEHCKLHVWN